MKFHNKIQPNQVAIIPFFNYFYLEIINRLRNKNTKKACFFTTINAMIARWFIDHKINFGENYGEEKEKNVCWKEIHVKKT